MAVRSTSYSYEYASQTECNAYSMDIDFQKRGSIVILSATNMVINHGYVSASASGYTATIKKRYLVYAVGTEYLAFKIPMAFAPKSTTYFPMNFYRSSLIGADVTSPDTMGILKTDGSFYIKPLACAFTESETVGSVTLPAGLHMIQDATFDTSSNSLTDQTYPYYANFSGIYQIGG